MPAKFSTSCVCLRSCASAACCADVVHLCICHMCIMQQCAVHDVLLAV
jgi:hypothetical protein